MVIKMKLTKILVLTLIILSSNIFPQSFTYTSSSPAVIPFGQQTASKTFFFSYSGTSGLFRPKLLVIVDGTLKTNDLCHGEEPFLPSSYTINNLTSGTHTILFRLVSINTQTMNCYSVLIHKESEVILPVKFQVRIQNNFAPGVSTIIVDYANQTSPFDRTSFIGDNIVLSAVEQTYSNYNYIWNNSGANNSDWKYTLENQQFQFLSTSQSTSYNVSANDRNTIIQANLRKQCNVTVRNQISGTTIQGTVTVNGQTLTPPVYKTVIEQNTISVGAPAYYIVNGIRYNFNTWSDEYVSNNYTFTINQHKELIAKYKGTAIFNEVAADGNLRNQHFNDPRYAQNVTVYWNEHPNADVTAYKIYRKVAMYNGIPVSEGLVATVPRGTTSWQDADYIIGEGQNTEFRIDYSVCAYYSINQTTSEIIYQRVAANLPPAANKQTAENELQDKNIIVDNYSVSNYPNPFNPETTISYQLPEQGHVTIKVYDMLGKEVAELVNGIKDMGIYTAIFDACNLSTGIYVYSIQVKGLEENSKGFTASKKMLLIK
ncbi:MAG: hypothetical protein CVV23_16495 [Ignavibacteriae bacterium HGW-Ignavibacteriae-2]|jgi:hypothetical protein|nr:MAG: hypothetical protein CVV23_16495 [Ignavibacteriae bacterium HGW-Ignavibacteriae-2]